MVFNDINESLCAAPLHACMGMIVYKAEAFKLLVIAPEFILNKPVVNMCIPTLVEGKPCDTDDFTSPSGRCAKLLSLKPFCGLRESFFWLKPLLCIFERFILVANGFFMVKEPGPDCLRCLLCGSR